MAEFVSPKMRREVAERAGHVCEYCFAPFAFSPSPFNIEHIVPISLGGLTELLNLAFSCNGCNGSKSNKTHAEDPVSGQWSPLFHPRKDVWSEHFGWSEDSFLVIGMTPTGRATVETLRLNRPELLNIRQLLALVGKHPPAF
jgi:5-methylcytosine-specific restriction endonuclease McrA